MMYKQLATLVTATLFTLTANAGVIFEDNFDSEVPDVLVQSGSDTNYTSFTNWTVTSGTVDLVANGDFGLSCAGNTGKCVDLDGSSRNAGTFQSTALTLDPGTYTLSFDISGNQRGSADDTMLVTFGTLGDLFTESFTLAANSPWQTIVRSLTVTTQINDSLVFNHDGRDNIGILLDNVSIVPEPGTLALLGLGLTGLLVGRRKKAA